MQQPLSPHLQVYRPQITSISSITHRITMVFIGFSLLVWALFLYKLSIGGGGFREFLSYFNTFIGKIYLVKLGFCLTYHFLNGVRHIFWDFGIGFDLCISKTISWIIFAVSIISSILISWRLF
jgi:succinate dehydrogenase / fumarate reductase cytochrome b subunit